MTTRAAVALEDERRRFLGWLSTQHELRFYHPDLVWLAWLAAIEDYKKRD